MELKLKRNFHVNLLFVHRNAHRSGPVEFFGVLTRTPGGEFISNLLFQRGRVFIHGICGGPWALAMGPGSGFGRLGLGGFQAFVLFFGISVFKPPVFPAF
jgi:hypothetical protein